jgi:hypothetical protein
MISFKDFYLTELIAKKDFEWTKHNGLHTTTFKIEDDTVKVFVEEGEEEAANEGLYVISFRVNDRWSKNKPTSPLRILSNVLSAVDNFVSKNKDKIKKISFSAFSDDAISLYDSLANRIAKELGWAVRKPRYDSWIIEPKRERS